MSHTMSHDHSARRAPHLIWLGLAAALAGCDVPGGLSHQLDADVGLSDEEVELDSATGARTHTTFGADGKLSGTVGGWAWVHGSPKTSITAPASCDDAGCFRDVAGELCTAGTMSPLTCTGVGTPALACDWGARYGTMIGLNVGEQPGAPWGDAAPAELAVRYHGAAGSYRLTAHVAGEPDGEVYCFENYPSGTPLAAEDLVRDCWGSGGRPLPSFEAVDRLTLTLLPTQSEQPFEFCVSDVIGGDMAPARRYASIAEDGRLGGDLSGYAWVHGSAKSHITEPASCDDSGCFRETHGRLCLRGSLEALSCEGAGTAAIQCDWATHYGVMIGLNVTERDQPWGSRAPARLAIAVDGDAVDYRLTAHVAGDPDEKIYCLERYRPGSFVSAADLRSECWGEGGQRLPSFEAVDRLAVMQLPGTEARFVDYCIDAIVTE